MQFQKWLKPLLLLNLGVVAQTLDKRRFSLTFLREILCLQAVFDQQQAAESLNARLIKAKKTQVRNSVSQF